MKRPDYERTGATPEKLARALLRPVNKKTPKRPVNQAAQRRKPSPKAP